MQGTIMRGIGGFYTCRAENGECFTLRAQAKFRREHLKPMVGDRVEMQPGTEGEDGWILSILPRENALTRPPVANIECLALVLAAETPDPDLDMTDRMLVSAGMNGISVLLCVNKADLAPEKAGEIARQYAGAVSGVHIVSARDGTGIDRLRDALRGRVAAFAGQSGAGKSSLINALFSLSQETGELSERIERGKNTTRRCELLPVPGGGMLLDTPGFSLFDAPLMPPEDVQNYCPEFRPYTGKCYFPNCCHVSEPGCAVRDAVRDGEISGERHARYVKLVLEMRERWKARY